MSIVAIGVARRPRDRSAGGTARSPGPRRGGRPGTGPAPGCAATTSACDLVAERRRVGERRLVAVVRRRGTTVATTAFASGSVSTRYCCGWTLPPLGACWAAARQVRSSSSVTGSSVNRRIARVVMIDSIVALGRPSAQRPSNVGSRRAMNASTPSTWSAAEEARSSPAAVETSKLVSNACLSWALTASLVPWTASGAPAASRRAHAIARSATSAGGQTSDATPSRCASAAVSGSPSSRWRLAASDPTQQRPDRGAAVAGDEPDLDVRIDDHGRVGHHDHVAQQGDRRAEPGRGAVERRTRSGPRRRAGPRRSAWPRAAGRG